ncbi:hypothetical protein BD560DRAFT_406959 [Blakeslea trispora]|nr:hypothetical protein BD560DRAFT_406959 [Blakeslea trispora]
MSEQKPNQINTVQKQEQQFPNTPEAEATAPPFSPLPRGNMDILKEAFPETDTEVIEAVLQAQNDNIESSFEVLLGMSDPSYKVTVATPPMPPRPQNEAPYAYWQRQEQQQVEQPISVEEQMRLDEAYAKQLLEEDRRYSQQRRQQQQQQQQQQHNRQNSEEESLFNFQDELPVIKEKMKEAGNAAKKKVLDFYNQLKANTQKNMNSYQQDSTGSSSMPTTNAQYRGLPSDDGDDLLTGDISALHLSDYDVYAQTGQRQREFEEKKYMNNQLENHDSDTIHVNPPVNEANRLPTKIQTSTSDVQLKADEDFARQLAEEEQQQMRESRSRQSSANNDIVTSMHSKKTASPTVVIAPRSPLELGDSDYEDVGLTAAPSRPAVLNNRNESEKNNNSDNLVPYIIGDDDESDSDDLVNIEEAGKKEEKLEKHQETNNKPHLVDHQEQKTEDSNTKA